MRALGRRSQKRGGVSPGMTLVEIMIVVIVMALIASGVAYAVVPSITGARETQTENDCKMLQNAVSIYMMQNGACPESFADLSISGGSRRVDPWGQDFVIICNLDDEPQVYSLGPDGEQGTGDDISSREESSSHE